jgi:hypothetical protein
MEELTDNQLEFIQADLAAGMKYSQMKMVADLTTKLTNQGKSKKEIMAALTQQHLANHWDVPAGMALSL